MTQTGFKKKFLKFRFGLKARITLYERLAAFLENNTPIVDTLIRIQMRYKENKDYRADILADWLVILKKGSSFADAVQSWVPASEHMLIAAGERGQNLIQGLQEATVMSTASKNIKSAIIAGLAMPAFLLVLLGFMLARFQTDMAPIFKSLLPVTSWSSSGQTLDTLSSFIVNYWWMVLIGFVVFGVSSGLSLGRWSGKGRSIADRFPPWSIYRTAQASSFMIGLASLMKAGVAGFDALRSMHKTASPWMQSHLEKMMSTMRLGGPHSGKALNTGLLDKETAGDVEDYSQLGQFQDAVYLLGSRTMKESVEKINARMAVLRTVLLILVAVSIGWIYSTIYGLQTMIASSMNAGG